MAPTLPLIGVTPNVAFFHTLEWLALGLVLVLLVGAFSFSFLLVAIVRVCLVQNLGQHHPDGCCRHIKTAFLSVGKWLCVYTFPALFKMHKTRSGRGRQLRKFMVFLDREVHFQDNTDSLLLITAFYSIILSIFCSSAGVFFRYFPVEKSAECLETDNHGRTLFCYSNSSLPVDCANFSLTELRELQFQCYAIALPAGLGIAVAAALGLAKVVIVGVTFYVKVTEWFFTVAKNPPRKLQEVCCCNCGKRQCGICMSIYVVMTVFFLCTVAVITLVCGMFFVADYADRDQDPIHITYYVAYVLLPMLICFSLLIVISYLTSHCDKGEYASIGADQRPPNPSDCGVESQPSVTSRQHDEHLGRGRGSIINCEGRDRAEGEHDEENFGREGGRGNANHATEGARLTGTTSGASNRSYGATSLVASLH